MERYSFPRHVTHNGILNYEDVLPKHRTLR